MIDQVTDKNVLELRQIVDDSLTIPAPDSGPELGPDSGPDSGPGLGPDEVPTLGEDFADAQSAAPKEAHIWTYFGANGGAGVTSLAVQVAWELSSQEINGPGSQGATTVLVDLDFERGDCAAYMDTIPSISIAELNNTEGRMDADLAASYIRQINPGLSLISAHSELGGNDQVSVGALLSLLDTISGMFDFIVLDVPPMWRPWTQAVIGAADKFALVTEARVPALHQTKKLSADIREAMALENPPEVILNKFERRSLRGGLSLSDAVKVLGDVACQQICVDDETVRIAINTGQPAGTLKPNSRYVKSVRAHVQNWYQDHVDFGQSLQRPDRRIARG